ncbi:hypothetical protein Y032_0025g1238 [Ancylostoma ceylanicum]|uniref:Uncharacterized protein n=1 Tax=Ancylostoma ceylanicum TaxID=53326 RepID=A0A016UW25_9BILA|nr:hypothetical protein Y032_0025g1238 [Ancylostoma ceylanicum]
MTKQTRSSTGSEAGMPLWASKLIERFDAYSNSMQTSIRDALDRVLSQIDSIQSTQESIIARLEDLEAKINLVHGSVSNQKSLLYSTIVKVKADSERIDDKLKRIAWIGIDEKSDVQSTHRFDHEILREVIHTSGDDELIRELEQGQITSHRHPMGKPRGPGQRGRIIKICLPIQALRDSLLAHTRSGRQSLTQQFVHSYARRDYTAEELSLDRMLRKEASDLNAREGKLAYIVRDFDIVKLNTPRDLPRRPLAGTSPSQVRQPRTENMMDAAQAPLTRSRKRLQPSSPLTSSATQA